MLFGLTEYDDGVYFGSSIRLVQGVLPYRDFVLVHPPGFELLASPVAWLSRAIGTRDGMAVLRLCMALVAAINVLLVGALIRHRGRLPTLVGAGLMAVFPAEVGATHTALLEPVLDSFCLLGALLVFRGGETLGGSRQLLLGGIALGFAGTVKGWALIPALVIAVLCLPEIRRRLVPFTCGVTIGFGVPTLPFVIAAPGSFYHDVVATQLARVGGSTRIPLTTRLGDLIGAPPIFHGWLAIAVAIGLVVVVGLALARSSRRPTAFEWFAVGSTLGIAALLMLPAQFYSHYAAFIAPFLAIAVAGAVGLLVSPPHVRTALAMVAFVLIALTANHARVIGAAHASDKATSIDAVIPAGACALADSPADLITADRFVSAVAGCGDNISDPYGTTISYGGRKPATVAVWQHAFDHSDYLVLYSLRNGRIPMVPSLRADLSDHFRLIRTDGLLVYVRNGFDVSSSTGSLRLRLRDAVEERNHGR
jgi:Dolichyl-phosphate-mannose-protein mannosyltransferase